jgi:hypothetical protein
VVWTRSIRYDFNSVKWIFNMWILGNPHFLTDLTCNFCIVALNDSISNLTSFLTFDILNYLR